MDEAVVFQEFRERTSLTHLGALNPHEYWAEVSGV